MPTVRSDSMSDEQAKEQKEEYWWVTVHGQKRGPYLDGGSAFAAARAAKRANPNLHVAVMDPRGISTPID
jgi:hypothetical protein